MSIRNQAAVPSNRQRLGDGAEILHQAVRAALPHYSEAPAADALETGSLEVAVLDQDGRILSVNAAWEAANAHLAVIGVPSGVGACYLQVCAHNIANFDEANFRRQLTDLIRHPSHSVAYTFAVGPPGAMLWKRLRIVTLTVGETVQLLAMQEDLTAVAQMRSALRAAAEELLSVQDKERQRIGMELHDSTGQHLAALGLGLAQLRRLLRGRAGADDVLGAMAKSVQQAAREIRVISYLMQPQNLRQDGLAKTTERFVGGFGVRTGLSTSFYLMGAVDTASPVAQHAIFRVTQEGLANAHKHAHATHLTVTLTCHNGRIGVTISDDGQGMGPYGVETPSLGVGIPGMRYRVEQLGGSLSISSSSAGTTIVATCPADAT